VLTKANPDEIQSYLSDSSYMQNGWADRVVFPETAEEIGNILAHASREKTPVTISGAGTGTVGGRIPMGGVVLATDRLNQIRSMVRAGSGGSAVAEAGVRLADFQRFVETENLLYPPDPTERGCYLGGTVATNASGARSFKYGPTRRYVRRLKIVLASGELLDLRRSENRADESGIVRLSLPSGKVIEARLPEYSMPHVRKHASGYYVAPRMDALDLFIGSEGTLGVIVEAELDLIAKPEELISGIVFFAAEEKLLSFVSEARARSLHTRARSVASSQGDQAEPDIDARALEYFDEESLRFLRQKYPAIPASAVGAIFFEQETPKGTEDRLLTCWQSLLENHQALAEDSWFAANEADQAKLREFRHQLPVLMNEWFARHSQRKVSTDMALPDENFAEMLHFYKQTLKASELRYTIFGHIGDNHVHVNILPRNDQEAKEARAIYLTFIRRAVVLGGTISAEHGIGKLKRDYLRELYTEDQLRAMAALKQAFDPAGILGRGNIFAEEFLAESVRSNTPGN
jgi:D-lactate dehydrogenase (cytochrome)